MIDELRKKIDSIDDKIAALYLERQDTVREIGEEKARTHSAVLDPAREKKIIARVTKTADDEQKIYLKRVFETILETSRAYQRRLVAPVTPLSDELRRVLMEGKKYFPVSSTVACQGVEGSYSSIAADKLFEIADITYFKNFEGVFQAVEKGLCDYGVLPIENSAVGSVNAVYDLMKKHRFYIVRSVKLKVCHHLPVDALVLLLLAVHLAGDVCQNSFRLRRALFGIILLEDDSAVLCHADFIKLFHVGGVDREELDALIDRQRAVFCLHQHAIVER